MALSALSCPMRAQVLPQQRTVPGQGGVDWFAYKRDAGGSNPPAPTKFMQLDGLFSAGARVVAKMKSASATALIACQGTGSAEVLEMERSVTLPTRLHPFRVSACVSHGSAPVSPGAQGLDQGRDDLVQVADDGVVGDLHQVIPAVVEALRAR